jgi:hypothetical protein
VTFDALEPALAALQSHVTEIAQEASRSPAETKLRRYGPEQQVVARLEISGPQRRLASIYAGIDIQADGSTRPYLGRVRRRPIDVAADEHPAAAIRRILQDR